jgi:type I restriction enzyme S subunit
MKYVDPEGVPKRRGAFLEAGDLLVVRSGAYTGDSAIVPQKYEGAVAGYDMIVRVNSGFSEQYLSFCFLSEGFEAQVAVCSGRAAQSHLNAEELGGFSIPSPPLPEQRAIAAYLDRETERIDALVAKKERLITKGLDDDAEMKDSGVEWLGEIPAGWEVVKLKYGLESIEQGWSPQCESRQAGPDEWAVLKVGCVNGHTFDSSEHKALPSDTDPKAEYQINPGDVLMSRANTRELLGSAAVVDDHYPRLLLCDKLYRLATNDEIDPDFLVAQLTSVAVRHQLERDATGASASMQNISQNTVQNLRFLKPPYSEQQRIAHYLDQQISRYKLLIGRIRDGIDRLKEYRTALISAAVTGHIDVRKEV